jgi:hypothetical protein
MWKANSLSEYKYTKKIWRIQEFPEKILNRKYEINGDALRRHNNLLIGFLAKKSG